jgi:hypothetical protein
VLKIVYKNGKLIELLKNRGTMIADGNLKEIQKIENKLNKLIVDN